MERFKLITTQKLEELLWKSPVKLFYPFHKKRQVYANIMPVCPRHKLWVFVLRRIFVP